MPRPTGWSVLALKALELAVPALALRAMQRPSPSRTPELAEEELQDAAVSAPAPEPEPPRASTITGQVPDEAAQPHPYTVANTGDPLQFLRESADSNARFFRAGDGQIEVLVALFSDGRVRIAGPGDRRFAGMIDRERGELVEIGSNEWTRVFLRETPQGKTQLELHGGPYDTRVLTCEPFDATEIAH